MSRASPFLTLLFHNDYDAGVSAVSVTVISLSLMVMSSLRTRMVIARTATCPSIAKAKVRHATHVPEAL